MEAIWFARRAALHCLSQQHPNWTNADLAAAVGGSESFVKKWLARLKQAPLTDPTLYHARSHARHTPPLSTPRPIVERILALRDEPPAHLRRMPGPRTILAFLQQDAEALALGVPLPRSTRTVWKVLRAHDRIATDLPSQHQPLVPPEPLEEIQADFTDVGSVRAEPDGKLQHVSMRLPGACRHAMLRAWRLALSLPGAERLHVRRDWLLLESLASLIKEVETELEHQATQEPWAAQMPFRLATPWDRTAE